MCAPTITATGWAALTDPQGNNYDQLLTLTPFQSAKIFDSDGDQTAMVIYVCRAAGQASGVSLGRGVGPGPIHGQRGRAGVGFGHDRPALALLCGGQGL